MSNSLTNPGLSPPAKFEPPYASPGHLPAKQLALDPPFHAKLSKKKEDTQSPPVATTLPGTSKEDTFTRLFARQAQPLLFLYTFF
jgi:hypothetical protein